MLTEPCDSPFRRIQVDHYIRSESLVKWTLRPEFTDALPHIFQLQAGRTASNASADWENVGLSINNAFQALDDRQRLHGKRLLTHYRVLLSTPVNTYVSQPSPVYGELNQRDWRLAREMVRKELLRHRYVSRDGTLLKRMRFGTKCTQCLDTLTDEVLNSDCPECAGTGFLVGYHTPIPLQLFDLSPESINEERDGNRMRGTIRDDRVSARTTACVQLNKHDVWVDSKSDQRWVVHKIKHGAELRGIPLVFNVELRLAPFSHAVYKVEVGGESAALFGPILPPLGTGEFTVDHDFGGVDNFAVVQDVNKKVLGQVCDEGTETVGVLGATIKAFTKADFDAGNLGDAFVIAQTTTRANGRWASSFQLDAGDYVISFSQVGVDTIFQGITVPFVAAPSSSSSLSAPSSSSLSSSSSSFWSI